MYIRNLILKENKVLDNNIPSGHHILDYKVVFILLLAV